jgi:hypothetical protein
MTVIFRGVAEMPQARALGGRGRRSSHLIDDCRWTRPGAAYQTFRTMPEPV